MNVAQHETTSKTLSEKQTTAAVFKSGNSQAVRLPKAFEFNSKRVSVERVGGAIVLRPVAQSMADIMRTLQDFQDKSNPPLYWPESHEDAVSEKDDLATW